MSTPESNAPTAKPPVTRMMIAMLIVSAVIVIGGIAGGVAFALAAGGAAAGARPADALRGTWECLQYPDRGSDTSSTWTFEITDSEIRVDNPDTEFSFVEEYAIDGGVLTITDADENMRIQQGYEDAATMRLPSAIPADGDALPVELLLPNGDAWPMTVVRSGSGYLVDIGGGPDETWACAPAGQSVPDLSVLDGVDGVASGDPAEGPALVAADATWSEGCVVAEGGDEGNGQKRTPTAYSHVTTRAPSMEPYVVCAWEQTDLETGEHLAFIAQIDSSQIGQAIGPLYSDGWDLCTYEGSSAFVFHPDDPGTILQLAESDTVANLILHSQLIHQSSCTAQP